MSQLRIIPVVTAAASALLLLKGAALITEGRFVLTGTTPAVASGGGERGEASPAIGNPAALLTDKTMNKSTPLDLERPSEGEMEVLRRLQARREELDKRAVELDQREALLKATEKRIDQRISELAAIEARIKEKVAVQDAQRSEELRSLVSMYENMKPVDAARIFDRLDHPVLLQIARQVKPVKMAAIVAALDPEVAQRLTLDLANGQDGAAANPQTLPKIGENTGSTPRQ